MQIQKAINIVRSKGDRLQRARLAHLLNEDLDPKILEELIQERQLPNGGFPYQQKIGNPYCLSPTSMMLKIMAETNLLNTAVCQQTIGFVKQIQYPGGYWDENPAILEFDPPHWDRPGELVTKLWLTGALCDSLIRLNQGTSAEVKKARNFLLQFRKNDGRFEGPLVVTWLAIAVFSPHVGFQDDIAQKALVYLESISDWDSTDLCWALDCLFWAGAPKENKVVKQLLTYLIEKQNSVGYWSSSDNPLDQVGTTLESLIVLTYFQRY